MIVKIFTDLESISHDELEAAIATLPHWRAKRVRRYHREIDRKLSTMAYLLLQEILREDYGVTDQSEWIYNECDKPSLANHPEINFNISHCPSGVVCVVSGNPIGVDIESTANYDSEVATHIANDEELQKINSSEIPELEFTKLWTKKESYIKLQGKSIDEDLKTILKRAKGVIFNTLKVDNEYVVTVCQYE